MLEARGPEDSCGTYLAGKMDGSSRHFTLCQVVCPSVDELLSRGVEGPGNLQRHDAKGRHTLGQCLPAEELSLGIK